MPNTIETLASKNYAIMRVERIRELGEMRRIDQHNTREKLSENVEPDGPEPRELIPVPCPPRRPSACRTTMRWSRSQA